MLDWGAREVIGVDSSVEAVHKARSLFGAEGVEFHCRDAGRLSPDDLGEAFDLAVCIETIEHVPDPAALLRLLRRCVRPSGLILVTCPNDHWYYPNDTEANPFHVRKYRFDEFRAIAESELGPGSWRLGTGLLGFASLPIADSLVADDATPQDAMLEVREAAIQIVPAPMQLAPTAATAGFYVGLWGQSDHRQIDGAAFAVSMDVVAAASSGRLEDRGIATRGIALQAELRALAEAVEPKLVRRAALGSATGALAEGRSALLVQAFERENRLLRDRVAALDEAQAAATQVTAQAHARVSELGERVRAAEQLSQQWASALNAERARVADAEARFEEMRRELESHRLRLALVERDRAALQLRIDELQWVASPPPSPSPSVAALPMPESRPPRLHYRVYRRVKGLVPASLRQSLGPKVARWLPRP
jgi:hypothetical protein